MGDPPRLLWMKRIPKKDTAMCPNEDPGQPAPESFLAQLCEPREGGHAPEMT